MEYIKLFAMLLFWHALADFPLQGDFLANAKRGMFEYDRDGFNCVSEHEGVPGWYALAIHAAIHAGGVAIIADSLLAGAVEFIAHMAIDNAKNEKRIDFLTDQGLHILTKVVIVFGILIFGGAL